MSSIAAKGLEPISFVSFCGGLPERSTKTSSQGTANSLNYKFSWSPLGVLRASLNDAKFLLHGRINKIKGTELMQENFGQVFIDGARSRTGMVGIANRDSLSYAKQYGLEGDQVRSLIRGTLR